MTENDNQKLDLLVKIAEQTEKRFDQIDKRFEQMESRFDQIDKRFEQMENSFDQIDKRFEQMESRFDQIEQTRKEDRAEWRRGFDEIKYDLRLDKEKLEKVYEARNQVTVNFSRAFATTNAFIAGVLAVIVSLFMNIDK